MAEYEKKEAKPFAGDETTATDDEGGTTGEEEEEPTVHADETGLRLGPPGPPFGIVINGSSLVSRLLTN